MFADQLITGAQVAAGVVVGIVGVNMAQKSVGWHHVVYETESGDVQTESVPINVSGMEADTEGNAVVSEYARRAYSACSAGRSTSPRTRPSTAPTARRASRSNTRSPARDRDRRERVDHADGQTDADSEPDVEADYVYSSPIELSYDKFVGMKESNRRKDIRLTSLESTVAVLEKNLRNWSAASRAGSTKRNSRSSRRSNRSATLSVRRRRNPTGSRIRVIRTSTLATPNRTAAGRRPPMEAPNEHPSHSRRITGHNGSAAAGPPLRHPTQTHRHRRSSSKRTTARTRRTRTTRRPVAVRIPTSRMTNRPSTPTTARPARPPACASRRSTSAKSGWEPRRPTATPSTQPPVRSHSSRCRRRRRTHESRSRPRAPNSLKANKRSASITTTTPRPPTARATTKLSCSSRTARRRRSASRPPETGVSVAASDYAEYQALIEEMEEPATERGFEATPEGLIEYHSWQQDRVGDHRVVPR